jgi:hypothetical protein
MKPARYKPLSDTNAEELVKKLQGARDNTTKKLKKDIKNLGFFLASPAGCDILRKKKQAITAYLKGEKSSFALGCSILFSRHFFKILGMALSLYRINKKSDTPEIQKALLENGEVLDFIGENADLCKDLVSTYLSHNQTTIGKTAKLLAPGVFDLLKNSESRKNLQQIVLEEYMKFIDVTDLTKDDGYDFNYYSRGLYNDFSPDYLGLISRMGQLISQQNIQPPSLKYILNQHSAEITEELAEIIEKDRFVGLPQSLSSTFPEAYATELNDTIVKV